MEYFHNINKTHYSLITKFDWDKIKWIMNSVCLAVIELIIDAEYEIKIYQNNFGKKFRTIMSIKNHNPENYLKTNYKGKPLSEIGKKFFKIKKKIMTVKLNILC